MRSFARKANSTRLTPRVLSTTSGRASADCVFNSVVSPFPHHFGSLPIHSATRPATQSGLTLSKPNDRYEQEADRIAARLTQTTTPMVAVGERSARAAGNSGPARKQDGALDAGVRADFEARLGHDLSGVRVHTGSKAALAAEQLGARAFTVGRDIVFASGTYAPGTAAGRALLAHELVHVIQQGPPGGGTALAGTISRGAQGVIQRAVGYVGCRNATGRVRELVGNDPVGTVTAADARAIELLDRAIASLEWTRAQIRAGEPPYWPTIADPLGAGLSDRFGLDPEDREIWTTNNRLTRTGGASISLLLFRLNAVRRILARGNLRYDCLNSPPCPEMSRPGEVVLGAEAYGEYGGNTITLCEGFWRDNHSADDRALFLVHEAFHVYFAGTDAGRHMWNAHCVEQFVGDVNGIPVPEGYETTCA